MHGAGPIRKPPATDGTGTQAARGRAAVPAAGAPSSAPAAAGGAWDIARIPLLPAEPGPAPTLLVRRKLAIGTADDPSEAEADRIAERVLAEPGPDAAVAAGATSGGGAPSGIPAPAIAHDVLRQPGHPLDPADRAFFERRFGHDFARVRVHTDTRAAASAARLAARAWTAGDHIVFGAGTYRPAAPASRRLLAHELAHVVQQGGRRPTLRRSPLSDAVKAAWTADPSVDALLARLSQPDVQAATSDPDLDAELARLLAGRPDDLWVAQRVRQGRLGMTTGALGPPRHGRPPRRRGRSKRISSAERRDRRALVIAGVHGTERQGMEVARRLISDLSTQQPRYTVIVVPSLFPDNAASRAARKRHHPHQPQLSARRARIWPRRARQATAPPSMPRPTRRAGAPARSCPRTSCCSN